jgi:hypothetical protein
MGWWPAHVAATTASEAARTGQGSGALSPDLVAGDQKDQAPFKTIGLAFLVPLSAQSAL